MYVCVVSIHRNKRMQTFHTDKNLTQGADILKSVYKKNPNKTKTKTYVGWREQQKTLHSNSPTRDTEVIVFTENTQYS